MIQSTNISLTSNNSLLTVSQRSVVSSKTVTSFSLFSYNQIVTKKKTISKVSCIVVMLVDKKNEHKEVAVNDFLPSEKAHEAIQYSM